MTPPPGLPFVQCGIVTFVIHSDRQRGLDGHRLRRCGEPIGHRQPFLVQDWVPVFREPFDEWEEIPMHRLVRLTGDGVSADVQAVDPYPETAPRTAVCRIVEHVLIGIRLEREAHGEPSGVAGEALPGAHRLPLCLDRWSTRSRPRALRVMRPSCSHLRRTSEGTCVKGTG
jgi:hypothetical protein